MGMRINRRRSGNKASVSGPTVPVVVFAWRFWCTSVTRVSSCPSPSPTRAREICNTICGGTCRKAKQGGGASGGGGGGKEEEEKRRRKRGGGEEEEEEREEERRGGEGEEEKDGQREKE